MKHVSGDVHAWNVSAIILVYTKDSQAIPEHIGLTDGYSRINLKALAYC
jgi:hypothetical protein